MTNNEILRGSFKLEFKEIVGDIPRSPGFISHDSFKLYYDPDYEGIERIVCSTRVRRVNVGYCSLHFPYMPVHRQGRPTSFNEWRTYRCTSVKPVIQYQKTFTKKNGEHLFIHGSMKATPIGQAIRTIARDITEAETWKKAIIEAAFRPLKPKEAHFCFWTSNDRDLWGKFGAGVTNFNGYFVALKRDTGRFKYKRICRTKDFSRIRELSSALDRYAYFNQTLSELGYGTF